MQRGRRRQQPANLRNDPSNQQHSINVANESINLPSAQTNNTNVKIFNNAQNALATKNKEQNGSTPIFRAFIADEITGLLIAGTLILVALFCLFRPKKRTNNSHIKYVRTPRLFGPTQPSNDDQEKSKRNRKIVKNIMEFYQQESDDQDSVSNRKKKNKKKKNYIEQEDDYEPQYKQKNDMQIRNVIPKDQNALSEGSEDNVNCKNEKDSQQNQIDDTLKDNQQNNVQRAQIEQQDQQN